MVESLVRSLMLAFVVTVVAMAAMIFAISIGATSGIAMLVINACGGSASYGMCVLASLAAHVVLIGGYVALDWLLWKLDTRVCASSR